MSQYTKAELISASNATYFTNTSGGISASAVRDLNDTWISSSALLTGSNIFVGDQIVSGNIDTLGSFTSSLQTGYILVGSGGRTQAVSTSSIVTNIDTGSLVTTASFNSFTQSINQFTQSINQFTASQSTGSLLTTASFNGTNIGFTKADGS